MTEDHALWSFYGLVVGVIIGRIWFHAKRGELRRIWPFCLWFDRKTETNNPSPTVRSKSNGDTGVLVHDGKNGAVEVDRVLVKPSPIPRSLSIILIILAAITLGQAFLSQHQQTVSDKHDRVRACELTAQLKIRQDDGIAANAELAKALGVLLSTHDRTQAVSALSQLQNFYSTRSKASKTLPPLPPQAILDCRDGRFDGPK